MILNAPEVTIFSNNSMTGRKNNNNFEQSTAMLE